MPIAHETADDALDPAELRAQARMGVLREMAQIGLRLARALEREAEAAAAGTGHDAEPPPRRVEEITRCFAGVARAVSLAVALEEKIDRDRQARPFEAEAEALKRRALSVRIVEVESSSGLGRRRAQVAAAVEQVIAADESAARSPQQSLDLRARLDRLLACEAADFDLFMNHPAGEVVARICRGLGLDPDWSLWDAPWAVEAERAAAEAAARPPRSFAPASPGRSPPAKGAPAVPPLRRFRPPDD